VVAAFQQAMTDAIAPAFEREAAALGDDEAGHSASA
jgi:hypothetical protein